MRRSFTLASFLAAAVLLGGCASAYKSFYRETNHRVQTTPVPAAEVKVVKSVDDLEQAHTELGTYRGHAPTVREAMDAAKGICGDAGAHFFILYTEPYEAKGRWKVDGFCAVQGG